MNIRLSLAGLVLPTLLAAGSLAGLPATPALALPNSISCSYTTYYNDAHHDQVVGHSIHCGNGQVVKSGTTTGYYTTKSNSVPIGHSGGMPGDGQLPCEFLQKDCGGPFDGGRFGLDIVRKPPVRAGKPITVAKPIIVLKSGAPRSR